MTEVVLPGFEGAEKCLEVWFAPVVLPNTAERQGLFRIQRSDWDDMLKLVKCTVIGYSSNSHLDSYLLSESSMFVSPYRLVLKTCGTTTLLMCLDKLVELSRSVGLATVDQLFYNRNCFKFPEYQHFPHTNWDDEVTHLEKNFPGGSAYVVGKTNSAHWYVYLWGEGRANRIHECLESKDYTIEILMTGLHPDNEGLFTKEKGVLEDGKLQITQSLYNLYDNITIDDFMFDPCGYSCNGYTHKGSNYFTVHVTPEDHCSYASFESNIPPSETRTHKQLVLDVVKIFRPSEFTVCLFAEKDEFDEEVIHQLPCQDVGIGTTLNGHKRRDRILYEFEHYDLAFYHYQQKDASILNKSC
jgi:S-adenosylmethionine decarboxylase